MDSQEYTNHSEGDGEENASVVNEESLNEEREIPTSEENNALETAEKTEEQGAREEPVSTEELIPDPVLDEDSIPKARKSVPYSIFASVLCVVIAISIILTYTLTSAFWRKKYVSSILIPSMGESTGSSNTDFEIFELIESMLEKYSYYSDTMSEEEMLQTALKAYVLATGDRYATYYTEAEYAKLTASGSYAGIGVSVLQDTRTVQDVLYYGFTISYFYKNSPALQSTFQKGDFIYMIEVDGTFKSVEALGGYEKAITYIQGEPGTKVKLKALREGIDEPVVAEITRAYISDPSVTYEYKNHDINTKTAVVKIRSFDIETPKLFKTTMEQLLSNGVEHFVFDVRDNPGGDLLSIKAVLSYFLAEGDLVLAAINKDGRVDAEYRVEPMNFTDNYEPCSVLRSEIGIYANLDMIVLCNENTGSAAEVFTATMRDYEKAKIVGMKTFGKGIMQKIVDLSTISKFKGYLKLTTHAYVTQCGVSYHEKGIDPTEGLRVQLSDQAREYALYELPQSIDNQLQTAFSQLLSQ